jgi:hypothetical protein
MTWTVECSPLSVKGFIGYITNRLGVVAIIVGRLAGLCAATNTQLARAGFLKIATHFD